MCGGAGGTRGCAPRTLFRRPTCKGNYGGTLADEKCLKEVSDFKGAEATFSDFRGA